MQVFLFCNFMLSAVEHSLVPIFTTVVHRLGPDQAVTVGCDVRDVEVLAGIYVVDDALLVQILRVIHKPVVPAFLNYAVHIFVSLKLEQFLI